MKNRNFKKNNKPQQRSISRDISVAAEINVSPEADFVTLPRTEFMELVANNALLDAVKRIVDDNPYGNMTILRVMLSVNREKEAN